jgi:hypothetical protein
LRQDHRDQRVRLHQRTLRDQRHPRHQHPHRHREELPSPCPRHPAPAICPMCSLSAQTSWCSSLRSFAPKIRETRKSKTPSYSAGNETGSGRPSLNASGSSTASQASSTPTRRRFITLAEDAETLLGTESSPRSRMELAPMRHGKAGSQQSPKPLAKPTAERSRDGS